MPLFDVPGWSVLETPVSEVPKPSKKRKKEPDSELSARDDNPPKKIKGTPPQPQRGGTSSSPKRNYEKPRKRKDKRPKDSRPNVPDVPNVHEASVFPSQIKADALPKSEPSASKKNKKRSKRDGALPLTTLQSSMKESLEGAHFRMINERLYKSDSHEAHKMIHDDPKIFEDYHAGFRRQVQHWPTNPVECFITSLSTYPAKTVIADLGCGEATIARSLISKGMVVLSFDLASGNPYVIEADICGRIPLPGSEGIPEQESAGEGHIVDVVICALSLMSTNWPSCLREAWRILKDNGELMIAEVSSRFSKVKDFEKLVSSIGFKFISKDESNTHFTLFHFKKRPRKYKSMEEWDKILEKTTILKPCEYKRR